MRADGSWDDPADELDENLDSAGMGFDVADFPTLLGDSDAETDWWSAEDGHSAEIDGDDPDVTFTVGNPSGTLSASAGLGGLIRRIDVNDIAGLDEAQLGEEITELAALAREKARAAQHEVIAELMRRQGQDRAAASALLRHSVGLPTYESASAHLAETMSARYRTNDG